MLSLDSVVITGIGCVTPLGIGREAFLSGLLSGQSAIERLYQLDDADKTSLFGAQVNDFVGKQYVTPRKALKVMSREVQIAYAAAQLAWQDAFGDDFQPESDRIGVIYGSEMIHGSIDDVEGAVRACTDEGKFSSQQWGEKFSKEIFPLWMLKNLPNMPACHVGIAVDARGPNNTICQEEASGLLALLEAESMIRRGAADVVIVGAIGARVSPTRLSFRPYPLYNQHPASTEGAEFSRAFSDKQYGISPSEAGVVLVLESARHAMQRKANVLAVLKSVASRFGAPAREHAGNSQAISDAITAAMQQAELEHEDVSHVCAQGYGHRELDSAEATAIASAAPGVPVTAMSSYLGTAGAACGLLELSASLLTSLSSRVLPVHGTEKASADSSINVLTDASVPRSSSFVKTSYTPAGLAAAAVIECNQAASE